MALPTFLLGSLVVGGGLVGGALITRAVLGSKSVQITGPQQATFVVRPVETKPTEGEHHIVEFNTLEEAMGPGSGAYRGKPGVGIQILAKGPSYAVVRPMLEELSRQNPDVLFVQMDMGTIQKQMTGKGFDTEGVIVTAGPLTEEPVSCAMLTEGPQTLSQKLSAKGEPLPPVGACSEVDTRKSELTMATLEELVGAVQQLAGP